MSKFFIHRPVFAGVIAIVIVLAGLLSAKLLAVAQYPEIAPPTVLVTAYQANAELPHSASPAPIEQLSGEEEAPPASARPRRRTQRDLRLPSARHQRRRLAWMNNHRVRRALPRLPDEVRRNGVIVQKRSFDILLVVSLVSPGNQRDTLFLSNYASLNIVDELKRHRHRRRHHLRRARLLDARLDQPGEDGAPRRHAGGRRGGYLRAQNAQYATRSASAPSRRRRGRTSSTP